MPERTTWFEQFNERHHNDPEYAVEKLLLQFNREIRRFMRHAHITQTDLAEKLGVSQAYVSRMLNYNQNLTIRSLALIANALEAEWESPFLQENNLDKESSQDIGTEAMQSLQKRRPA